MIAHNTIPVSGLEGLDDNLRNEILQLQKGNLFVSLRQSSSKVQYL